MTVWKLVKDGVTIKKHTTKWVCWIEAVERGLVVEWGADFRGDRSGVSLANGVEIVEVEE